MLKSKNKEDNKMKKQLLMIMAIALLLPEMALAEDTLTIIFKDGRRQTFNYQDIKRIDFDSDDSSGYSRHARDSYRETNVDGLWTTSQGDARFWQTGNEISGSYLPEDHGELTGEIHGNVFSGYWIEDKSDRRCPSSKNGRYYWGRVKLTFEGRKFQGKWGYCDADPDRSWTGSRK
jgi:hypothetical protein